MSCEYCEKGRHIIHTKRKWVWVTRIVVGEPYYALVVRWRKPFGFFGEEWEPIEFCPKCGKSLKGEL